METTIQEVLKASDKINEELEGLLGDEDGDMDPWIFVEVQAMSQHGIIVQFLGQTIWSSSWAISRDISVEDYMRKEINELIQKISTIKL